MCIKWAGEDRKEEDYRGSDRRTSIFRRIAGRLHCCIEGFFAYGRGTNRWYTL